MVASVTFRRAIPDDAEAAAELVEEVFDAFVAPDYVPEGIRAFHAYNEVETVRQRLQGQGSGWVAERDGAVIGYMEMRGSHITRLFVDGRWQRRGIGRRLVEAARTDVAASPVLGSTGDRRTITVNAAPSSVAAYVRLGFKATGPQQEKDGIAFVPMEMPVG